MVYADVSQKCDIIKIRDYPSLFLEVFFPTFPLIFLIFMTSYGWFLRLFVPLLWTMHMGSLIGEGTAIWLLSPPFFILEYLKDVRKCVAHIKAKWYAQINIWLKAYIWSNKGKYFVCECVWARWRACLFVVLVCVLVYARMQGS